jgi:hypothetical protein
MHEALGDRTACELDDGEGAGRARTLLESVRRRVREADELRNAEPPCREVGLEGEARVGRQADVEAAGRQAPVRVADEEERRRVLLPDELERGSGSGPEPSKIGAARRVGVPRFGLQPFYAWIEVPSGSRP